MWQWYSKIASKSGAARSFATWPKIGCQNKHFGAIRLGLVYFLSTHGPICNLLGHPIYNSHELGGAEGSAKHSEVTEDYLIDTMEAVSVGEVLEDQQAAWL